MFDDYALLWKFKKGASRDKDEFYVEIPSKENCYSKW